MAIDPPYRLDPFQNIIAVNWGGPPLWATLEFSAPAPSAFVTSSFGTGTPSAPVAPNQGYTAGNCTSFLNSWGLAVGFDGSSNPDTYTVNGGPLSGSDTVTGNFAADFSISVGAGATMTAVGPSDGYRAGVWSGGAAYTFKPGSPGTPASSDPTSSLYLPDVGGPGTNNLWRVGSYNFDYNVYSDVITGPANASLNYPHSGTLLAPCTTGTFGNVSPTTIFTLSKAFGGYSITTTQAGRTIDYVHVASYGDSSGFFAMLLLGTPRTA